MPHLHLEYTGNLALDQDLKLLLASLNQALAGIEVAPLADIKSRASKYEHFLIADGAAHHAFVHLQVRLLTGRDASVLGRLAQICMKTLEEALEPRKGALRCQISVEVLQMDRSTYKKQWLNVS